MAPDGIVRAYAHLRRCVLDDESGSPGEEKKVFAVHIQQPIIGRARDQIYARLAQRYGRSPVLCLLVRRMSLVLCVCLCACVAVPPPAARSMPSRCGYLPRCDNASLQPWKPDANAGGQGRAGHSILKTNYRWPHKRTPTAVRSDLVRADRGSGCCTVCTQYHVVT